MQSTHFCRKRRTEQMPTMRMPTQMPEATNTIHLTLPEETFSLVTNIQTQELPGCQALHGAPMQTKKQFILCLFSKGERLLRRVNS